MPEPAILMAHEAAADVIAAAERLESDEAALRRLRSYALTFHAREEYLEFADALSHSVLASRQPFFADLAQRMRGIAAEWPR